MASGKFYLVKCKCGSEQKVYSHSTMVVKCDGCKEPLAHPSGGSAVISGTIVKEL
ncbi:MAG: zinc finger domain-containing protein [Candidatus Bilamarchaeum sp.]|jgi:ribosomal protein S27E